MGYQKSIRGDDNESNEQLSHNKVTVHVNGAAPTLLVCFIILLLCAALGWLVLHYGTLLTVLGLVLVLVAFLCSIALLVARTCTSVSIMISQHRHAAITASVAVATDHYVVWREDDGTHQFRGSTIITENRQFLPREVSPPSQQEAILTCYDTGMSGRAIEKHLNAIAKDAGSPKVSYREISKTLDLYRPDWNKKTVVNGDLPKDEV